MLNEKDEEITPEIFQEKLWTWMEEKGVFSEMKTQLRRQMIEVLKASEIGETVFKDQKTKRGLSPKYKAINLLIAEYLLQQGYQYALSIFSVEDPTLSTLPEQISNRSRKKENEEKKDVIFKFLNEDVWDILETLGFPRESEEIKIVYNNYYSASSKDTLIICLIKSLSVLVNKIIQGNIINYKLSQSKDDKSNKYMKTQSTQSDFNDIHKNIDEDTYDKIVKKVHNEMQIAFDRELKVIKKSERKKYLGQIKNIENEMMLQLKKEKIKLSEREVSLRNNLHKELNAEFNRLQEKERFKEIEIERNLQKELELEKQKLFDQYRKIIEENKNINTTTLIDLQQASLETALKAVQHQSSRLKKKEDILDKKIQNFNLSKINADFSCQFDDENAIGKTLNVNSSSQTENSSVHSAACQVEFEKNEVDKTSSIVQTNICLSTSACQTDPESIDKNENTVQTMDQFMKSEIHPTKRAKFKFDRYKEIVDSLQNLLKNLQEENSTLKNQVLQQRSQINDMTMKYTSMSKEVTEARFEAQELSKQLLELGKTIMVDNENDLRIKKSKCVSHVNDDSANKSKSKKVDYKFSDKGLEKIKETLKMLEKEGEELDRSYREFKLRQLDEFTSDIYKKDNNVGCKSFTSISSSSLLLKHLQDKKCRENQIKGMQESVNLRFTTDNINNFYLNEKNPYDEIPLRILTNFNDSRNILQNYVSISTDSKMYDSKNPKAFADMLAKKRSNYKYNYGDIEKKSYSTRNPSSRIVANQIKTKNDIFSNRKFHFRSPKSDIKQAISVENDLNDQKISSTNVATDFVAVKKSILTLNSTEKSEENPAKNNLKPSRNISLFNKNKFDKEIEKKCIENSNNKSQRKKMSLESTEYQLSDNNKINEVNFKKTHVNNNINVVNKIDKLYSVDNSSILIENKRKILNENSENFDGSIRKETIVEESNLPIINGTLTNVNDEYYERSFITVIAANERKIMENCSDRSAEKSSVENCVNETKIDESESGESIMINEREGEIVDNESLKESIMLNDGKFGENISENFDVSNAHKNIMAIDENVPQNEEKISTDDELAIRIFTEKDCDNPIIDDDDDNDKNNENLLIKNKSEIIENNDNRHFANIEIVIDKENDDLSSKSVNQLENSNEEWKILKIVDDELKSSREFSDAYQGKSESPVVEHDSIDLKISSSDDELLSRISVPHDSDENDSFWK